MSAWTPAPPPLSEPAMIRTRPRAHRGMRQRCGHRGRLRPPGPGRVSRTSWTRTAADAGARRRPGRRRASRRGGRPASAARASTARDEALAAGAQQHREAERDDPVAGARAGRGCAPAVLPKPMPGSSQIVSRATPGRHRRLGARGQEGGDLGDHVVVARLGLHGRAARPACASARPRSRARRRPPGCRARGAGR